MLTYDAEWLGRNSYTLTDVARVRPLHVIVAVPKADGAYLIREAERRGLTTESLAGSIGDIVTRAARLWRDAKKPPSSLHNGSRLSVVEHELDLGYEVVTIDRTTIVTLAAPGDSDDLQDRVAFVYSKRPKSIRPAFSLLTSHYWRA